MLSCVSIEKNNHLDLRTTCIWVQTGKTKNPYLKNTMSRWLFPLTHIIYHFSSAKLAFLKKKVEKSFMPVPLSHKRPLLHLPNASTSSGFHQLSSTLWRWCHIWICLCISSIRPMSSMSSSDVPSIHIPFTILALESLAMVVKFKTPLREIYNGGEAIFP